MVLALTFKPMYYAFQLLWMLAEVECHTLPQGIHGVKSITRGEVLAKKKRKEKQNV